MAPPEIVVVIPESTRKRPGGDARAPKGGFADALPPAARGSLTRLRKEVLEKSPKGNVDAGGFLPAWVRFDGNMYRHIPREAWEGRAKGVEILIASGLFGVLGSGDAIPSYAHSMAEAMPPFGKLNRWWRDAGLPGILHEYLAAVRPRIVVDLLSLEYREAVQGYAEGLTGIAMRTVDFPGTGRGSQPRRGEKVAEILRTGRA